MDLATGILRPDLLDDVTLVMGGLCAHSAGEPKRKPSNTASNTGRFRVHRLSGLRAETTICWPPRRKRTERQRIRSPPSCIRELLGIEWTIPQCPPYHHKVTVGFDNLHVVPVPAKSCDVGLTFLRHPGQQLQCSKLPESIASTWPKAPSPRCACFWPGGRHIDRYMSEP